MMIKVNSIYLVVFAVLMISTVVAGIAMLSLNKYGYDTNNTDDSEITDALSETDLNANSQPVNTAPVEDVDELKIETLVEGNDPAAKNGDTLEVNYVGTLLDGTKFDSSYDRNETFEFVLGNGNVIQGWEQGMLGMKVGEKRRLTIPSSLGYGEGGAGATIPGNAGLVFEVELVSIKAQ